jgi:hypothetical protein
MDLDRTIKRFRHRLSYAFGRHHAMMINDPASIVTNDQRGLSAEIEKSEPVPHVLVKVLDWKGDARGDVWEIKRRLTIEQAKELAHWLSKRVLEHQKPLHTRMWNRVRGREDDIT